MHFIKLVKQAGLYVHIRIGPYVCAEWSFPMEGWPPAAPPLETALTSAATGRTMKMGTSAGSPPSPGLRLQRQHQVHDDYLLRWLATGRQSWCEVCGREITISPLYAPNAPARLPVSEFMLGLGNKAMGWAFLLLSLLFAIFVWEFDMPITTLWTWRLALSRNLLKCAACSPSATPPAPFSRMASTGSGSCLRDLGHFRQRNGLVRIAADALAPLALWIVAWKLNFRTYPDCILLFLVLFL